MSTIFPPPLLRRFPNSCNSRGGPAVLPLCATKFRLPKPFRSPGERKSGSPPLRGRPPRDKLDLPEQKYLRLRRNCRESGFRKNFVGLSISRRAEYLPAGRRALDFQFEARQFCPCRNRKIPRIPRLRPLHRFPLKSCGFPGAETARKRFLLWGAGFPDAKKRPFPGANAAGFDKTAKGFPPSRALLRFFARLLPVPCGGNFVLFY